MIMGGYFGSAKHEQHQEDADVFAQQRHFVGGVATQLRWWIILFDLKKKKLYIIGKKLITIVSTDAFNREFFFKFLRWMASAIIGLNNLNSRMVLSYNKSMLSVIWL